MNCYYHHHVNAVGICKSCNKGLCPDCLTDVENGIACTSTCVEEVKRLNELINRNKHSYKKTSGDFKKNAFIYGAFGLVFIIFGVIMGDVMFPFSIVLGAVFLIAAALNVVSAQRHGREQ